MELSAKPSIPPGAPPTALSRSRMPYSALRSSRTSSQSKCNCSPVRSDIPGQAALLNWDFESSRNDSDYLGLGQAIRELLDSGLKVEDKDTKELRSIQAGDVGVLCRYNEQVGFAVTSLTRWGVPSASPRSGLLGTAEAIYVMACLRRMNDPSDTVASALILTLAESTPVETWLADRLNHLATEEAKPHEWKTKGNNAPSTAGSS